MRTHAHVYTFISSGGGEVAVCVCVCVCVCVQNFVYLSEDPVIEAHGREEGAGEGREGEGRETALYQEERETR